MIYLSIGSNLGDRLKFLQLAVGLISYRISKVKMFQGFMKLLQWVLKEIHFIIYALK